jgi:hypothetical protein
VPRRQPGFGYQVVVGSEVTKEHSQADCERILAIVKGCLGALGGYTCGGLGGSERQGRAVILFRVPREGADAVKAARIKRPPRRRHKKVS